MHKANIMWTCERWENALYRYQRTVQGLNRLQSVSRCGMLTVQLHATTAVPSFYKYAHEWLCHQLSTTGHSGGLRLRAPAMNCSSPGPRPTLFHVISHLPLHSFPAFSFPLPANKGITCRKNTGSKMTNFFTKLNDRPLQHSLRNYTTSLLTCISFIKIPNVQYRASTVAHLKVERLVSACSFSNFRTI